MPEKEGNMRTIRPGAMNVIRMHRILKLIYMRDYLQEDIYNSMILSSERDTEFIGYHAIYEAMVAQIKNEAIRLDTEPEKP